MINSIEAIKGVDGICELLIETQRSADGQILVSITDIGIRFTSQLAEQIFDPFFTPKFHGTVWGYASIVQ